MPLNFNYAAVANKDVVCTSPSNPDEYHPVFNALVWLSMICGYSNITAKNYGEVHARIAQYEQVCGSLFKSANDKGQSRELRLTLEDIKLYIGMYTNASPLTDAQWAKKIAQLARENGLRAAMRQNVNAFDLVVKRHKELDTLAG